MQRLFFFSFLLVAGITCAAAQSLYFPPLSSSEWATTDPAELDWCPDKVANLLQFLDDKNTKSFIVLKDGKIVIEAYFDDFTRDSVWYWASAGKTLMATLVGLAQEDGDLDINDKTSDYLGTGWTSAPLDKENLITIRHQITMTTGLDETGGSGSGQIDCLDPACLVYLADAGDRWFYFNSPYRLTQDVVEAATGKSLNVFTYQRLNNRIGMGGGWFNYVYYSTARSMARFGLLTLNKGTWQNDVVMSDTSYFTAMTTPSQTPNPSYGYLWWLNGQSSFKLPTLTVSFPGPMVAEAPADLFSALGKNDQKLYVVPSQQLVVVRMGEAAGTSVAGPSSFDNQLWALLSDLSCTSATGEAREEVSVTLSPNPGSGSFTIQSDAPILAVNIFDSRGQWVARPAARNGRDVSFSLTVPGVYWVRVRTGKGVQTRRLAVI